MNEYLNELFVSVESGEITAEDATELYNIFSEAEETEESGGAHQRVAKMIENKLHNLKELRKEYHKFKNTQAAEIVKMKINKAEKDLYKLLDKSGLSMDSYKYFKHATEFNKPGNETAKKFPGSAEAYKLLAKAKKDAFKDMMNKKALKESVSEDDLKLAIYEAFESGEITEDEKYELLSDLY